MTVKELIRELQNVPEDAIVLGDSHLYQYNCIVDGVDYDEEKVFTYLYHLIWMLSHQRKLFTRNEYYEEFALTMAEDMFLRLTNPKQFEIGEDGQFRLPKIKSILNYIKRILYARKVSFEQDYYSQSLAIIPELEEEVLISRFNVINQLYKYTRDYNEVELLECLEKINIIIQNYIKNIPYLTSVIEKQNIYISCMLTLSSLFDNALKYKEPISMIDNVILYRLNRDMEDYILVLCRRLLRQIYEMFKIDSSILFVDEKEAINTMALEAKNSSDILYIYE
mgnify:CR=1 FL=1